MLGLAGALGGSTIPGVGSITDTLKKKASAVTDKLPGPLKGIADKAAKQAGLSPAEPVAPPGPPPRDTSFMKGGENLGMYYLKGLTLVPFIGSFGVNLVAVDATGWGAAKGAIRALLLVGTKLLLRLFPRSILVWIYATMFKYLDPWYLYDIAQIFNPKFNEQGFKIPFVEKQIGVKGGEAYFNIKVLSAIFVALSLGGLQILEWIPDSVVGAAKPWIQIGIAAVGGLAAAATGGIAGLPAMYNAYKTWKGTMGSGTPQAGGGGKADIPGNYTGSGMPSLRVIAGTLLGPNPAGDSFPYASDKMSGGGDGPSKEAAGLALGALAFVTLGGISLALIRSKGEGGALAE